MSNYYPNGSEVRIYAKYRIRNANQTPRALTNPSVVTFSYTDPNGVGVSKTYPDTVVRPSTGIYYLDITADVVGVWHWRTDGDGSVTEGEFSIQPSVFEP